MNMENPRIKIGGNNPPIGEELRERYHDAFDRLKEVEAAAALVPEKIASDEDAGKAQDLIKAMRVAVSTADGARKAEKAEYDAIVKQIDATFKIPIDKVKAASDKIRSRLDTYLEEKAAAERRRREEEAERLRAEAEAKQREAEEAERRRVEAENKRLDEERKAREAEEARARAIREREEAEERAAKAKAEEAQLKAQRLADEAEAARRKKEREELEQYEREAAEQRRKEQLRLEEEARQRRLAEEKAAAEAKAKADEERRKQREAEEAAAAAKREERRENRAADAALDSAVRHEKRADRMDGHAQAGEAELSRTRGELGTVGSLAQRMTYVIVDANRIPLERLRGYIAADAIEAAVSRFLTANRNQLTDGNTTALPGVVFEIVKEARVA